MEMEKPMKEFRGRTPTCLAEIRKISGWQRGWQQETGRISTWTEKVKTVGTDDGMWRFDFVFGQFCKCRNGSVSGRIGSKTVSMISPI